MTPLIKSYWLEACDFETGDKITAKILLGCIVITCQNTDIKQAEQTLEQVRAAEQRLKETLLRY